MDKRSRTEIELACTRLVNQFAVYNDHSRFDELVALFTEDGRYARPIAPDLLLDGHEAILGAFTSRPKERVGRHLITNILIDVHSETSASGICYATLYSGTDSEPAEKFGLQAHASQFIGEFHDRFVLTDSGWKFSERRGCIVFTT